MSPMSQSEHGELEEKKKRKETKKTPWVLCGARSHRRGEGNMLVRLGAWEEPIRTSPLMEWNSLLNTVRGKTSFTRRLRRARRMTSQNDVRTRVCERRRCWRLTLIDFWTPYGLISLMFRMTSDSNYGSTPRTQREQASERASELRTQIHRPRSFILCTLWWYLGLIYAL